MNPLTFRSLLLCGVGLLCVTLFLRPVLEGAEEAAKPAPLKAFVDGQGTGWRSLGAEDFTHVNCEPGTWAWKDGEVHCTGTPTGVIRSTKQYTNFEMVATWMHERDAGNSGIFVWASEASLKALQPGGLPQGIEVQVLDLGHTSHFDKATGQKSDWFTCHGDEFPVGEVKMTPFPPVAPAGGRSFPSKQLSRGFGQWNHYYVRCINGEVRLWVNGEEVSGGTAIEPRTGYLCLESEGSPVVFKGLRIRELP